MSLPVTWSLKSSVVTGQGAPREDYDPKDCLVFRVTGTRARSSLESGSFPEQGSNADSIVLAMKMPSGSQEEGKEGRGPCETSALPSRQRRLRTLLDRQLSKVLSCL